MKKLLIPLLTLSSVCAFAEDDAAKPLEVGAELGILNIKGNTESSSIKAKLEIKQEFTKWRNSYLLEGLSKHDTVLDGNGTDDKTDDVKVDQSSAEKYLASAQTDYKVGKKHQGLFMYGSYERDRFSGYDYQGTIAAGYSDRLFKTDSSHLNYSIGPGIAFAKTEETDLLPSESTDTPIVRLYALYQYNISKGAKFTQLVSSDYAPDSDQNTKSKSETALTAQLSASFALKVAYIATHNSQVPVGIEKVDSSTSVTFVYSY